MILSQNTPVLPAGNLGYFQIVVLRDHSERRRAWALFFSLSCFRDRIIDLGLCDRERISSLSVQTFASRTQPRQPSACGPHCGRRHPPPTWGVSGNKPWLYSGGHFGQFTLWVGVANEMEAEFIE